MAISAKIDFYLNGKLIPAPVEWADIEIVASFDNEAVQANITTDKFTFVNEARLEVLAYIEEGKAGGLGIFEGLPFRIQASNADSTLSVFDGFLDLADGLVDFPEQGRLEVSVTKADGLNGLNDRLSAVTMGFLKEQGFILDSDFVDIPYVVAKPTNLADIATLGIASYLLAKAVAEQAEKVSKDIANVTAHLTGGVSGAAASLTYSIAAAIISISYAVALIAALTQILIQIINTILPIRRTAKATKLKKMLQAIAAYSGYELETDIPELESLVYLPSNNSVDAENATTGFIEAIGSNSSGIPNSSDFGYQALEVVQLCKDLFNARFAVSDNGSKLQFRSLNSSYWVKTASYALPDVLPLSTEYNTNELNANLLLSFDTDVSDIWTIENYQGTAYEIITDAVTTSNPKAKALRGLGEKRFNVCLGNRKDNLNAVENVLLGFATAADALINTFAFIAGAPDSNLAATIRGKTDLLKVGENNWSKPKLLYVDDSGVQPQNHRDLFSAKSLWQNYHVWNSFVSNNYNGQKLVFNGLRIPFGLGDYIKLVENSYIATSDGSESKVTSLKWRLGGDFAVIDRWVREPYTTNLTETFIEPT